MAHKNTWILRFGKFGIHIAKFRKDGKFCYFNFAIGFGEPKNSFAKHCIYLYLNPPQRVNGIVLLKGIKLHKAWGSLL